MPPYNRTQTLILVATAANCWPENEANQKTGKWLETIPPDELTQIARNGDRRPKECVDLCQQPK